MAFRQRFFDTPEVTEIVLPKVLQNFKLHLLAQGTEPKTFLFFFRVTHITGREKFFSKNYFPPKGPSPPLQFLGQSSFATEWMLKNPKESSLSLFRHRETFFIFFIKGSTVHQYLTFRSPFVLLSLRYGADLGRSRLVIFTSFFVHIFLNHFESNDILERKTSCKRFLKLFKRWILSLLCIVSRM